MFYFVLLILSIIFIIIRADKKINKNYTIPPMHNSSIEQTPETNYFLHNFVTKNYVMTQTELAFYRELKKVTDKLNLIIFPQVALEKIIQVKNKNSADRNRIKARSIDYTIVNNTNCKIVCCIELDDKSHDAAKAKEADRLKDALFKTVNIPLHRIKVGYNYNLEEIENLLKISLPIQDNEKL